MDTTKVIVTLLILSIILSVATVAFTAFQGNKTLVIDERKGTDRATVGLYVEGGPNGTPTTGGSNVGLYVEDSK